MQFNFSFDKVSMYGIIHSWSDGKERRLLCQLSKKESWHNKYLTPPCCLIYGRSGCLSCVPIMINCHFYCPEHDLISIIEIPQFFFCIFPIIVRNFSARGHHYRRYESYENYGATFLFFVIIFSFFFFFNIMFSTFIWPHKLIHIYFFLKCNR